MDLYDRGQLALVFEKATVLTNQYPEACAVWNLMGAISDGELDPNGEPLMVEYTLDEWNDINT